MIYIFLFCLFVLFYTYIIYPFILLVISFFKKNKNKIIKNFYPEVTIIMVAFNEELNIENRIKNILNSNYPTEKLNLFIASDGSIDKTNEIIIHYVNVHGIKGFIFNQQKGKSYRLNQLMKKVKTPITIMCDLRQRFHPDAIVELVKNFYDPKIGAVSGELIVSDNSASSIDVSLYWEYEKFIRKAESKIDSTNGVTGAIYALRTELFKPIPNDTILDDVLIPMQVIKKGYRVIFDSSAKAFDYVQENGIKEYRRKVRTLAGNFQLIFEHSWLLNPFKNRIFFQFFSHKFLRLTIPFVLIVILIINFFLLGKFIFNILFVLQIVFHILGTYTMILQNKGKSIRNRFLRIIHTFYALNIAVLEGLFQYLFKKELVKWK